MHRNVEAIDRAKNDQAVTAMSLQETTPLLEANVYGSAYPRAKKEAPFREERPGYRA